MWTLEDVGGAEYNGRGVEIKLRLLRRLIVCSERQSVWWNLTRIQSQDITRRRKAIK